MKNRREMIKNSQLSHKNQTFGGALRALLQKISLRRRESRLAARASHSTVAVDFPETSLCGIPCGLCR
ncbi:MAG: hypothetical protein IKC89_00220, partial [Lentisphaeria bacterium]|nr:hypothetical protein [Lentisphaeria bacterium]